MTPTEDSYLLISDGKVSGYIGPDATALFHAMTTRGSLRLWKYGIRINRRTSLKLLLAKATFFTHKAYKSKDIDSAMDDLTAWIDAMRCALPVVTKEDHNG